MQPIGRFTVDTYGARIKVQHALVLDIVRLAEDNGVSVVFPARTVRVQDAGDAAAAANAGE